MWLKLGLLCIFGFSGSLTTSFDLRGVLDGNRMAGIPLGMTLGSGELDVEGICTRPGMACQNCSQAVTCVPLPVGWLKVPLEECKEGFTCNAHLGQCSSVPAPECSEPALDFEHSCEQVGIFPDAHDCRKFHLCSPPEGLPDGRPADHRPALCPRHYGYNPATAQCSIKLEHSQCSDTPVPECKTIGQHGVLALSSNHYYVCLTKNGVLHPQVFICPHGWHFWGDFCQPEPEKKPTEEPVTEKSSSEEKSLEEKGSEEVLTETTTEEVTTAEATTTKLPECKTIGQHGVLALSSNYYYVCLTKNGVLHPQVFICPHGWHFWGDFCQPEPEKKPTEEPVTEKSSSEEKSLEEKGSEEVLTETTTEEVTTAEATTTKLDLFFSTDKSTTYAADTFLADKLDLANYATIDDEEENNNNDFAMSIEYGW